MYSLTNLLATAVQLLIQTLKQSANHEAECSVNVYALKVTFDSSMGVAVK